jgi:hypothetical protein
MVDNFTELEGFLDKLKIPVRLACTTETGWPVVLSLWFVHRDGRLYCATQESARVVNYLKNDPRCGFEIAEDHPPYCGVRGQAKANIRKDIGVEILEELLLRYLGTLEHPLAKDLLSKGETEVAIELEPLQIFTWNFSKRMKGISHIGMVDEAKTCP